MKLLTLNRIFTLFLGILLGVYATHFLIQINICSPVVASAFVGVVSSLLPLKKWHKRTNLTTAIYCGSFVGMGSILSSSELVLATLLATGGVIVLSNSFKGFGGKLGFIAYLASLVTSILLNFSSLNFHTLAQFSPIVKIDQITAIGLASILGFFLTTYINHKLRKTAVLASALPSFMIGLLCYYVYLPNGSLIALSCFSASFVGMLSEKLLPKKIYWILIVGHILIFILLKNSLGNFGGALGTIAFLAVCFTKCLVYLPSIKN